MSLKTTMFQEIPFNSFRGESLTKHYRRTLGLVKNSIPSATSLRGEYEFQHTSNLTNLTLTTLFSSPGCSQGELLPSLCVRRPSVRPSSIRRKLFIQRSSPLKLLGQLKPNLVTMVLGCSPFKIVSGSSGSNPKFTN